MTPGNLFAETGELEGIKTEYGSTQTSNLDELKLLCEGYETQELTAADLVELKARGKITCAPSTIRRYVKGYKNTDTGEWIVKPGSYMELTAEGQESKLDDRLLLGGEIESFMAQVAIRLCRRKNGMSDKEFISWARTIISKQQGRFYKKSLAKWYKL